MNFDPQTWQLTTARLTLRPPQLEDAAVLNAAIHASFSELHQWMDWARTPPTLAESEDRVQKAAAAFQRAETLGSTRMWRHDDILIGCVGLHPCNPEVPSFEMGYWCHSHYVGQGYTSEAARALATFALAHLDAQRLEIRCDARNIGSRRVAEKSGFILEAVLHHDMRGADGNLRDSCIYTRFPDSL